MLELRFIFRIIRNFPFYTFFLFLNEIIGTFLAVIGIGAIIPLLSNLMNGNMELTGKLGDLIYFFNLDKINTFSLVLFLIFILFCQILINFIRHSLAAYLAVKVGRDLREKLSTIIRDYDWDYFLKSDHGRYMHAMTEDTRTSVGAVNDVAGVISHASMTLFMLSSLFYISIEAFFLIVPIGTVFFLTLIPLTKKIRIFAKNYINAMGSFYNFMTDNNFIMKLLKAEGNESERIKLSSKYIKSLFNTQLKQSFFKIFIDHYNQFVVIIAFGLFSYYYLIYQDENGSTLVFILLMIQRLSVYFAGLQTKRSNMNQKIPSYFNCLELINSEKKIFKKIDKQKIQKTSLENQIISFDKVFYTYSNDKFVLRNITLSFPITGLLAVIGPSGSGKTTFIDLLLNLLIPSKGKIKVGNKSLDEIDKKTWQKLITHLPQNNYLFQGTVRENLCFGVNRNVSDEIIWRALKKVNCYKIIKDLPLQLDNTIRSSGDNFSGGERQRLSIARALLRGSKILILDEPSSNLDQKNEKEISKIIKFLKKDLLIIVVTHSLSFIKGMEDVVILKDGELIDRLSYNDLLKNKQYLSMIFP